MIINLINVHSMRVFRMENTNCWPINSILDNIGLVTIRKYKISGIGAEIKIRRKCMKKVGLN